MKPKLLKLLEDAFSPARCIGCFCEGTWFCKDCRNDFPLVVQECIICKTERPRGTTCISCREDTVLVGTISTGKYTNHALQNGIEWLKFKGVRPIAEILAGLLIPHLPLIAPIQELSAKAILVPIPLHSSKILARGFNQSEDIAHAIHKICDIEVAPLLTRIKHTQAQARLSHKDRPNNVKDAFLLACSQEEYIRITTNKPIMILIDDVSTTGSTLLEASSVFPPSDSIKIWGAVIARG